MPSTVTHLTRARVTRAFADIEPKLIAGLATALSSSQVISVIVGLLKGTDSLVLAEVATLVPTLAFMLAGYLKASTHRGGLQEQLAEHGAEDLRTVAKLAADAVPAAAPVFGGIEAFADVATNLAPVTAVLEPVPAPTADTGVLTLAH